jgi:hypothetical protein
MRDCTCVGSCRGAKGLGVGWNCVVDNGSVEDARSERPRGRCEGRYSVPQTSPPRDEPFDVTYRCALDNGHDGPHRAELDGPASGAPVAVDERSTERATAESTGTLERYGVVHRHEPGDPMYSHLPMADGYWTPWHIAQAALNQWKHLSGEAAKGLALADERISFYEQHTDKQANELVEVTIQRDKWLAAFNRSEQFQDGPKKQRDLLRAALVGLVGVDTRAELEELEAVMRPIPAPAQDKAATIDAIHALLAMLADDAGAVA